MGSGGTRKRAPSRGVDEKSYNVPAQKNNNILYRQAGFSQPCAPRKIGEY